VRLAGAAAEAGRGRWGQPVRAGAQRCARTYYDVYTGRAARPAAPGRAGGRAAAERAKNDTKQLTQGCNTS